MVMKMFLKTIELEKRSYNTIYDTFSIIKTTKNENSGKMTPLISCFRGMERSTTKTKIKVDERQFLKYLASFFFVSYYSIKF